MAEGIMPTEQAMEMDRLLLIHDIVTRVTDGLYQAPIDKDKTKLILDIGTGTGIWAISIGDEFPEATVIGNDLSANMPTFVPPNVKFEVDDVESPWLYDQKFDWIFCRYMAASIFEWPKLVNTIYDNLEPGGWAEFQDFDLQYYSDDGSLKPEDPLLFWISTLLDAARQLKRDPNPGSKLEGWAKDAGFQNIVHKKYKIPIGGLEGLSMRLYTNVLKWKVEEILVLLAKVRKDLKNPNIHALMDL
ncbi:putative methyltransferase domain-containing protein [Phaeoacremonium minimum UCRPA7]|uniref:Putative methyltransferase domain-containing protein n=1 Tax=Phaeoacremonium minimum (strain UCR-PA7) TaxID=1286976 RepID=R8BQS6_PHAM7|nr:putative methyltransferase domain-containing protein [Phaeoacremonium minimum UCRPA7]EOO01711.1 putative methyltransferase domain-containing protein [Phaeoacremonium minimum UCRPA7]